MSNNQGNTGSKSNGPTINNVVLLGRLTRDPELRETSGGSKTTTVTLAVGKRFAQGDQKADFISVVLWNQSAEYICNYAKKGSMISVEGRIQTRNYEDKKTGQRVYVTEVIGEQVNIINTGQNTNNQNNNNQGNYNQGNNNQGYDQGNNNQGYNQGNNNQGYDDFGSGDDEFGGPTLDISSDDLPF